jgi:hypothetical protein
MPGKIEGQNKSGFMGDTFPPRVEWPAEMRQKERESPAPAKKNEDGPGRKPSSSLKGKSRRHGRDARHQPTTFTTIFQ